MNSFGQLSVRMGRKTWNKNPFQKDAYRPLFTIQGERGLCPGGSLSPGGEKVSVWGSLSRGVFVQGVSVRETPHGQTDTCEIITLPQTSFAGANKAVS